MEEVAEFFLKNYRKVLGSFLGFIFGIIAINYGILKAAAVLILTVAGYLFGESLFKMDLRKWIVEKLTEGEEK